LCKSKAATEESTPPLSAHNTLASLTFFLIESTASSIKFAGVQSGLHLQISNKKFSKITESKTYFEELGYDDSIINYLSAAYQLWSEAEGLPQLSADEHDFDNLTPEQQTFIQTFIDMWDIVTDFEREYDDETGSE